MSLQVLLDWNSSSVANFILADTKFISQAGEKLRGAKMSHHSFPNISKCGKHVENGFSSAFELFILPDIML